MLEAQKTLFAIGTMDTKGQEVEYVAGVMRRALADKHPGWRVQTIDVSTSESPSVAADISAETILASLGQASSLPQRTQSTTVDALRKMDRSVAIEEMSRGLVAYLGELYRQGGVAGAIGLGGSGGTALIAPALRALPIGVPKLMVSTVASGNIAPYVGCSDLMMIPSIVDVSGQIGRAHV